MNPMSFLLGALIFFVIFYFVVGLPMLKRNKKKNNKKEFISIFSDFPLAFSQDERIWLVAKALIDLSEEKKVADGIETAFMEEFNRLQKSTPEEVVLFLKKQHERSVLALRSAEANGRFNKACTLASEFGFKKVALAIGWTEPSDCDYGCLF